MPFPVPISTRIHGGQVRPLRDARGTSLVEVLVATMVFAVATAAFVPLVAGSVRTIRTARDTGLATWMAWQKLEELRGLTYAHDLTGAPITDVWTDTTQAPAVHAGGSGLGPSPSSSLTADTPGYVDYLSQSGDRSSTRGVFVRRWAVESAGGTDSLIRIAVA